MADRIKTRDGAPAWTVCDVMVAIAAVDEKGVAIAIATAGNSR